MEGLQAMPDNIYLTGGGEVIPIMAYTRRLRLKGVYLTYMIQCKRCKKQYIGETKCTLR